MTTGSFKDFAVAVRNRFAEMSRGQMFVVATDRDLIWDTYLRAFPEGTNPTFKTRTEHDCSCCRHFIRDIGNVVAIENGALSSVWDLNGLPGPYQPVADAMSAYVKGCPVRDVFLKPFKTAGNAETRAFLDNTLFTFSHFSAAVPSSFVTHEGDSKRGIARTTHAVLTRGLTELTPESVETVADLIASNALYRGQEHAGAVNEFRGLQARFLALPEGPARDLLVWTMIGSPAARFRNTAIGTLVQDLSEGVDLERAVKSFETKVAPANYKRPTALITKGMVDQAMKTITELGLEADLERRHARFSDVSVNSVLFVDNAVRGKMKDGGLKSLLMDEVKPAAFDPKRAEPIGIDAFLANVLPKTTALQAYVENGHLGNFVSLTAPVHPSTGRLLRWSNDFAWSYDGNVADSIKDRVKRAGGQVEGVAMRVSLSWFNTDDLDLHITCPSGERIYYGNRAGRDGGTLDVDMNVHNTVRDPVENTRWTRPPPAGSYAVSVHQFTKRESIDVGFVIEVESAHGLDSFRFEKAVPARAEQAVCRIDVKSGRIEAITAAPGIVAGSISQERWGIKTLNLVRVNSVVLSPNYWDGNAIGNKHWFFILEGCNNPVPTRGFYNEFLSPRLETHRKVFEILGDKTKCQPAPDQMSGLGFSSTRREALTVVATGPSLNKTYSINF